MKDQRGVTLIELVMSLAIFAVVIGAIYGMLVAGGRGAMKTVSFAHAQQQLRAGTGVMESEVLWADKVLDARQTSVTVMVPAGQPCLETTFCDPVSRSTLFPYVMTLTYTGSTIERSHEWLVIPPVGTTRGVVAASVTQAQFDYYDNTGAAFSMVYVMVGHRTGTNVWDDVPRGPYATEAECYADEVNLDLAFRATHDVIRCDRRVSSVDADRAVRVVMTASVEVGGVFRTTIVTVALRGR